MRIDTDDAGVDSTPGRVHVLNITGQSSKSMCTPQCIPIETNVPLSDGAMDRPPAVLLVIFLTVLDKRHHKTATHRVLGNDMLHFAIIFERL